MWNYSKSKTAKEGEDPKICLKGVSDPEPTKFDLAAFFKKGTAATERSFFKYSGSLTKPPCTEQVDWFVLKAVGEVSSTQMEELKQYGLTTAGIAPNNIRIPQSLHGRRYSLSIQGSCPEMPPKRIEPPNLDYKYISMSHTTTIPAMASELANIKEVFEKQGDVSDVNAITLSEDLKLQNLPAGEKGEPPQEYSPETIKILMSKFLAGQGMEKKDVDNLTKNLNKGESKLIKK